MSPALTQIRDALEMVRDADIDRKLDGLPMMPHPARVSIVRALERVAEVEQAEGKVLEQLVDVNRRIDAAAKACAEKDAEIARLKARVAELELVADGDDARHDYVMGRLGDALARAEKAEAEVERLNAEVGRLQAEVTRLHNTHESGSEDLDDDCCDSCAALPWCAGASDCECHRTDDMGLDEGSDEPR